VMCVIDQKKKETTTHPRGGPGLMGLPPGE
jgi:hypothetical protein